MRCAVKPARPPLTSITRLRVLTFGASVADGGIPILSGGKIIGAIGVSGAAGHQDAQVAAAGANAIG